ncbi:hypothetical protein MnTg02_02417 [bacterium MnTg02]|nr:hypothetical protein MnTg02_02417 [bacterium MnTg02]
MAKTLFVDLKYRVVEAIAQDMPRRQAAERFGVSISSAIRWYQQYKSTGVIAPKKQGGDRRSGRIEAHADFILGLVSYTPDITLVELQEKLEARSVRVGIGTLWWFFDRRKITFKKRPRMRANWTGPIS